MPALSPKQHLAVDLWSSARATTRSALDLSLWARETELRAGAYCTVVVESGHMNNPYELTAQEWEEVAAVREVQEGFGLEQEAGAGDLAE